MAVIGGGSMGVNIDLLRWIPLGAKRVLQPSCGDGRLAAAYKLRNPSAEFVGLESDEDFWPEARSRTDQLLGCDLSSLSNDDRERIGTFDVVVIDCKLEQYLDEIQALRDCRRLLSDNGQLCLAAYNQAHWSVLVNSMNGSWPYTEHGLFSRKNKQLFTVEGLRKVQTTAGFHLERMRRHNGACDTVDAKRWISLLANSVEQAGADRNGFIERAQTLRYVSISRSQKAARDRLHIHIAALAPDFLDVRTRLPAEALESDASLVVSYREKSAALPGLPVQAPKVAVLQRFVMHEEGQWRAYLQRARAQGWILVYEIDDHPDLIGRVHQGGAMSRLIKLAIERGCHAVQTSTPALAAALRKLNPEVAVFENAILELPPFQERPNAARVFYGALNREAFSAQVAAALAPAIAAEPALEFTIVHDRAFFNALPTERKIFKPALSYPDFLKAMNTCDVVLSPLEGTSSELFKSDIKFLEAARCSAAMIASPSVYEGSIQDGATGLIARQMHEWPAQLLRLAKDPGLRNRIAYAAWQVVRDKRMLAQQVAARADWYRSLHARRVELDAALESRWSAPQDTRIDQAPNS